MIKKKELDTMIVLEGLFFYLAEYDQSFDQLDNIFIPHSTPFFHKIIHKLTKKKKYQVFFSKLLWQQRIFGPYCEQIEDVLSSLTMSRMLSWSESFGLKDRSSYLIERKLVNCWKKYYQEDFKEYSGLLKDLALDFVKETNKELEKEN